MDPITHLTSGALAGQALRGSIPSRLVLPFCALAAWIPDVDNLMGFGPEAYLIHHRGVTHSIFGGLILALIMAGIFRLISKNFSFAKAFVIAYALILVHIYLDLITSFGTQILAPFSRTRFALSSVFILDPFLTLPGLLIFVLSLFLKVRRRQAAVLGLAFMLIYPLAGLGVKHVVKTSLADRLARENISYEKLDVTTALFSPFYWKVVLDDGQSLGMATISLVPG
ncbi:MAG: metal-dependent hydrolase, partial [Thermodesulfobacteriota bacterium]|nr:metal-dependent hydrolase [Thermodesulfobacteriota bacterium]